MQYETIKLRSSKLQTPFYSQKYFIFAAKIKAVYLRPRDYDPSILSSNLAQILTNGTATDIGIRLIVEKYAKSKVYSHLKQKYYLDEEFTDTYVYSRFNPFVSNQAQVFFAGARVELNFPVYVPANTYNIGDTCSVGTAQYICNTNDTTGTFNADDWDEVGNQYDLWHVKIPYQIFSVYRNYHIGTFVFWKGKIYTCLQETADLTINDVLDSITISNVPLPNTFPGDGSTASLNQWGTGVSYSFTNTATAAPAWNSSTNYYPGNLVNHNNIQWVSLTGTIGATNLNNEPGSDEVNWAVSSFNGVAPNVPFGGSAWSSVTDYTAGAQVIYNDIIYISIFGTTGVPNVGNIPGTDTVNWLPLTWEYGDNRDQVILPIMVDITVKLLHERIPPKQIPELRQINYDNAIKMLHDIAHGELNCDTLLERQRGGTQTVTQVGTTKTQNTW